MSLSEQDREELRLMLCEGVEGIECSHFEDIIPCASDADALVPVVEALIARHVNAALTEAAERLTSHCNTAAAHIQGDDDVETVMAAKTYEHAARIVRDLRT